METKKLHLSYQDRMNNTRENPCGFTRAVSYPGFLGDNDTEGHIYYHEFPPYP
jgi:hypothetical protein